MNKGKAFYLLDASAAINHYITNPKVTPQLDLIIEQHGLKSAFLYVPQFCICELFNTLSKLHYRKKETYPQEYQEKYLKDYKPLSPEDFTKLCKNFQEDVRFGKLFYNYELNRYHTFNADHVMKLEHQTNLIRTNLKTSEEEPWLLSSFDILIIAMGIELAKIHGEGRTYILTCDRRIKVISDELKTAYLNPALKKKYNLPEYFPIPKVFYLYETTIGNFPKFKGQTIYN